jgi:hypothetical protein
VEADQPHYILGLCAGGDALGGQLGLIGVDRGQGGDSGDGGVVSSEQRFRGVGYGRGKQGYEGVDEVAVGLGREVYGRVWLVVLGFHSGLLEDTRKIVNGLAGWAVVPIVPWKAAITFLLWRWRRESSLPDDEKCGLRG